MTDITADTFEEVVIQGSRQRPVVVDFWAPWCGPCRALGPLLEALEQEANGAWLLAKLNVDEHPTLSRQFNIRGIPAVKAFRDGKVIDEFTGALPRPALEQWLSQLVPPAFEKTFEEGQKAEANQNYDVAHTAYQKVLGEQPHHTGALTGLARIALVNDDLDTATAYLDQVLPGKGGQEEREFQDLWFQLQARNLDPLDTLQARRNQDPADLQTRHDLAIALTARGDLDQALEELLHIVTVNRDFQDDLGRKTMLQIFPLLKDPEHLRFWQRRLGQAMY